MFPRAPAGTAEDTSDSFWGAPGKSFMCVDLRTLCVDPCIPAPILASPTRRRESMPIGSLPIRSCQPAKWPVGA